MKWMSKYSQNSQNRRNIQYLSPLVLVIVTLLLTGCRGFRLGVSDRLGDAPAPAGGSDR